MDSPAYFNGDSFIMTRYLKVQGNADLVRDCSTGAILNTNRQARINYEKKLERQSNEKARLEQLECRVSELQNDIKDIKYLLMNLALKK